MNNTRFLLPALLAIVLPAALGAVATAAPADADAQPAQWVQKDFQFTYLGFTTHYSCDGLHDKVKDILAQLGARKDSQVNYWGCSSTYGRPDPFPGVRAKIWVLEPLSPEDASTKDPHTVVAAHWQRVKLRLYPNTNTLSDAGECELVEQVKHQILPLFATRDVQFKSDCVPHQLTPGGTTLEANLLKPDKAAGAVAANP